MNRFVAIIALTFAVLLSPTDTLARDDKPEPQRDACECECTAYAGESPFATLGKIKISGRSCRANENGESCTHSDFPGKTGKKRFCKTTTTAASATGAAPGSISPNNVVKPLPLPPSPVVRARPVDKVGSGTTRVKTRASSPRLGRSPRPLSSSPEIAVRPLTVSECTGLGGGVGAEDDKCTKAGQFTCSTVTASKVDNKIVYKTNYVCIDE